MLRRCIVYALSGLLPYTALAEDAPSPTTQPVVCTTDTGYRGIWYANQPQEDEYKFKYSGGLATYPAKHVPIAHYDRKANKTFFVYGGCPDRAWENTEKRTLLIMISYYDHATQKVPRPRILMDKKTRDAHDNPTLMLDDAGHIWVFVAAHGTARPAYILRSVKPRDIDAFERVAETNFSYPQPWWVPGKGFLFLHTRYVGGERLLHFMTSPDGRKWSEPQLLAHMGKGHYQISWRFKNKIGTAFNYHPEKGGLNARTNLYYIETKDFGKTWTTAGGKKLELPLKSTDNPAPIRDYESMGRLIYLKDLSYDKRGFPTIVAIMAKNYRSGPKSGRRFWNTARWGGREWEVTGVIQSDNNYDTGCLYIDEDYSWHLIAPTTTGPQPYNTGGEMVHWSSKNHGRTWGKRSLTRDSVYNHSYARRPFNANPQFYALWADGHGRQPSASRLYFCDKDDNVYMLPAQMTEDFAKPKKIEQMP